MSATQSQGGSSDRAAVGALVRSAGDGNAASWKALVEGLGPLVWSVVRTHGLSDADAHEAYQRTWFRFAQHIGKIREPDRAGSWLASTARHECLRTIRERRRTTVEQVRAAEAFVERYRVEPSSRQNTRTTRSRSAWGLTSWASRIAGSHRDTDEWRAYLAGAPEEGIVLTPRQQQRAAFGFLIAAMRFRLHDLCGGLWWPVDWLLRTPARSNAFITAAVGAQAIYIVGDDGLSALVTEVWEPCGIAGAALYALSRWLRRVRGIELAAAEREPVDE